ncbi:MAG: hypothetical protein DRI94_12835 [Bacteroidetes bacterium]|nr:MAG: hypothetical protein DRI94_12835 [Bacteroidota bacterium]
MKKTVIILFASVFYLSSVFAQKTNDNGGTGDSKNNNKPPQNNDNNNNNTSDGLLLQLTKVIFGAYQTTLINKRGNDPSIFGIEAGVTGGFLTSASGSLIAVNPRIKLNRGALSFDARYDYLKGDSTSQNIDALAEFNIIIKGFKMVIGQGIMYNLENSSMYHESLLGIDLGINNKQIIVSPEFRLAYDWSVHKPVNSEFNLKGGYRLLKLSKASLYLNVGAGLRYMPEVTYGNVFGGINMVF